MATVTFLVTKDPQGRQVAFNIDRVLWIEEFESPIQGAQLNAPMKKVCDLRFEGGTILTIDQTMSSVVESINMSGMSPMERDMYLATKKHQEK